MSAAEEGDDEATTLAIGEEGDDPYPEPKGSEGGVALGGQADDHDRARCVVDELVADRAEQEPGETAVPTRADHGQRRLAAVAQQGVDPDDRGGHGRRVERTFDLEHQAPTALLGAANFGKSSQADLVIGVPFEDIDAISGAGAVNVLLVTLAQTELGPVIEQVGRA